MKHSSFLTLMKRLLSLVIISSVPILLSAQPEYSIHRPKSINHTIPYSDELGEWSYTYQRSFRYSHIRTMHVVGFADEVFYTSTFEEPGYSLAESVFEGSVELLDDGLIFRVPCMQGSIYQYRMMRLDQEGYLHEDAYYDSWIDSTAVISIYYLYNDSNKLIQRITRNRDGTAFTKQDYILDDLGRRSSEIHSCSNDLLNWVQTKEVLIYYSGYQTEANRDYEKYAPYTPIDYYGCTDILPPPLFVSSDWVVDRYEVIEDGETSHYAVLSFYEWPGPQGTIHRIMGTNYYFNIHGLLRKISVDYPIDISSCFEYELQPVGNSDDTIATGKHYLNAYPNPFNPSTSISYELSMPGNTKLEIYNLRGQVVRSFDPGYQSVGMYSWVFDGKDNAGRLLGTGLYMLRLKTADRTDWLKISLVK